MRRIEFHGRLTSRFRREGSSEYGWECEVLVTYVRRKARKRVTAVFASFSPLGHTDQNARGSCLARRPCSRESHLTHRPTHPPGPAGVFVFAEAGDGGEDRARFRSEDGGVLALARERSLLLPVAGAADAQEVRGRGG